MSVNGTVNTIQAEFLRSLRKNIISHISDGDGSLLGTQKICGYVCAIHPYPEEGSGSTDEAAGTVDVQEYGYGYEDDKSTELGLHKGVLFSAIQTNQNGFYVMPSLYSDVMIVQDSITLQEYVVMCSHVDVIKFQSHQKIKIGVVETDPFQESDSESVKDMDELEPTGKSALTTYDKDNLEHKVVDTSENNDKSSSLKQTASNIVHKVVGNDTVTITHDETQVKIEAKDSTVTIEANGTITVKGKTINIEGSDNMNIQGGGTLNCKGNVAPDETGGPFCGIKFCPFTGAPHSSNKATQC